MAHPRRRFGPLFRVTALVGLAAIISMPFWPTAHEQWTAWTLSRRLRDPVEPVRRDAAEQLVQLGPRATSWVIGAMRDLSAAVRRLACSILPRTVPEEAGRAVAALVTASRDSDASVRAAAVEQLGAFVSGGPLRTSAASREAALRAIRAALEDKAPPVRDASAWALWNLGPLAKSAVGDLDRALDGPDRSLRVLAAMTLLKIEGTDARPRIAASMTALMEDHSDPFNHWRALHTLKDAIGEEALATKLVPLLRHQDPTVRHGAMADLTIHCPTATTATAGVRDALASTDRMIRGDAALFLVSHHAELAAAALDVLVAEIVNPIEGTYGFSYLIEELKKVSPRSLPRVARSLADALPKTKEPENRTAVILSLGEIGGDASLAVPALLEAASSSDRLVAVRAIASLTRIDPGSAATKMPALLDWMNPGREPAVRLGALAALRDLGPAAATAVPALLKTVDEEDLTISAAAIEALSKIDPPAAVAIKRGIETGALRSQDD